MMYNWKADLLIDGVFIFMISSFPFTRLLQFLVLLAIRTVDTNHDVFLDRGIVRGFTKLPFMELTSDLHVRKIVAIDDYKKPVLCSRGEIDNVLNTHSHSLDAYAFVILYVFSNPSRLDDSNCVVPLFNVFDKLIHFYTSIGHEEFAYHLWEMKYSTFFIHRDAGLLGDQVEDESEYFKYLFTTSSHFDEAESLKSALNLDSFSINPWTMTWLFKSPLSSATSPSRSSRVIPFVENLPTVTTLTACKYPLFNPTGYYSLVNRLSFFHHKKNSATSFYYTPEPVNSIPQTLKKGNKTIHIKKSEKSVPAPWLKLDSLMALLVGSPPSKIHNSVSNTLYSNHSFLQRSPTSVSQEPKSENVKYIHNIEKLPHWVFWLDCDAYITRADHDIAEIPKLLSDRLGLPSSPSEEDVLRGRELYENFMSKSDRGWDPSVFDDVKHFNSSHVKVSQMAEITLKRSLTTSVPLLRELMRSLLLKAKEIVNTQGTTTAFKGSENRRADVQVEFEKLFRSEFVGINAGWSAAGGSRAPSFIVSRDGSFLNTGSFFARNGYDSIRLLIAARRQAAQSWRILHHVWWEQVALGQVTIIPGLLGHLLQTVNIMSEKNIHNINLSYVHVPDIVSLVMERKRKMKSKSSNNIEKEETLNDCSADSKIDFKALKYIFRNYPLNDRGFEPLKGLTSSTAKILYPFTIHPEIIPMPQRWLNSFSPFKEKFVGAHYKEDEDSVIHFAGWKRVTDLSQINDFSLLMHNLHGIYNSADATTSPTNFTSEGTDDDDLLWKSIVNGGIERNEKNSFINKKGNQQETQQASSYADDSDAADI